MTTRTLALIGLLCLGSAATVYTPPAEARTYVSLGINVAPPPPRHERIVIRRGYVWAPGYWRWEGRRHVWRGGYYIRERPGYVWVAAGWYRGPHGHWHQRPGYWRHR